MLLLLDNYDSFTYNLVHYFAELGEEVDVVRNDAITPEEVLSRHAGGAIRGVVISPGPCDPDQAGICLDLIKKAAGDCPFSAYASAINASARPMAARWCARLRPCTAR